MCWLAAYLTTGDAAVERNGQCTLKGSSCNVLDVVRGALEVLVTFSHLNLECAPATAAAVNLPYQ